MLFNAEAIPGVGYRLFWLCQEAEKHGGGKEKRGAGFVLDNGLLEVVVDKETGQLQRVWDRFNGREVLAGAGNQLQFFQDQGQYWDAWNIDPNYERYPLPAPQLKSISWLETGQIQQRLRVVLQFQHSEITQDYLLQADSPVLRMVTKVDWRETHVLLKAAFPFNLEADYASYEIACGTIERTTKPQTAAEKAQWEVFAHRWADLTDNSQTYGVSLLNDCKYGYDAKPEQLRLSLLRSPCWPDPEADRGEHHFTYALYPHRGTWQDGATVRRGYELNVPLQSLMLDVSKQEKTTTLPPTATLLNIGDESLILMACKQAEDDQKTMILRCYESQGQECDLTLNSQLDLEICDRVDCLERVTQQENICQIKPWQIASFTFKLSS
ncbi:MAG: hypothetical protein F6K24_32580 [Okeania sp. SIO2D1]|nr:hypothetical protein [Okeania sp. SIO2D1]